MKNYKKILEQFTPTAYVLIRQEWGQSPANIYQQILVAWDQIVVGQKIFLLSRKKYGLKSTLDFLRAKNLDPVVVGKGEGHDDARLVEFEKKTSGPLLQIKTNKPVAFLFREKAYQANVGNAVFSKTGLDEGTRFLLEVFFEQTRGLDQKMIGDLGAGWGAVSLILASEFPRTKIVAYENEPGALEAARENLGPFSTVSVLKADLTSEAEESLEDFKGKLDFIVSNFSFHIRATERERFFKNVRLLLKPGGEIFFVTEGRFVSGFQKTAEAVLEPMDQQTLGRYRVFRLKRAVR